MDFVKSGVYLQKFTDKGIKEQEVNIRSSFEIEAEKRLRKLPEFNIDPNYKSLAEQLQENESIQDADFYEAYGDRYPYAPAGMTINEIEFLEGIQRESYMKKKELLLYEEKELEEYRLSVKSTVLHKEDKSDKVNQTKKENGDKPRLKAYISIKKRKKLPKVKEQNENKVVNFDSNDSLSFGLLNKEDNTRCFNDDHVPSSYVSESMDSSKLSSEYNSLINDSSLHASIKNIISSSSNESTVSDVPSNEVSSAVVKKKKLKGSDLTKHSCQNVGYTVKYSDQPLNISETFQNDLKSIEPLPTISSSTITDNIETYISSTLNNSYDDDIRIPYS